MSQRVCVTASRLHIGTSVAILSWSLGPLKGSGPQRGFAVRFGEMPRGEQRQMKELFCPLMLQLKLRGIARSHGAMWTLRSHCTLSPCVTNHIPSPLAVLPRLNKGCSSWKQCCVEKSLPFFIFSSFVPFSFTYSSSIISFYCYYYYYFYHCHFYKGPIDFQFADIISQYWPITEISTMVYMFSDMFRYQNWL